jgi:hypothetical protein
MPIALADSRESVNTPLWTLVDWLPIGPLNSGEPDKGALNAGTAEFIVSFLSDTPARSTHRTSDVVLLRQRVFSFVTSAF